MKIAVYGAGATGGHFAVRLAQAGHDVSVVARGPHLAAIEANGLTLISGGREDTMPVRAAATAEGLGPQDVVIVATKATGLPGVAADLGALVRPDTLAVFPQNGMTWWYPIGLPQGRPPLPDLEVFGLGEAFLRVLSPEQVVGGVIYSANEVERPGVVHNSSKRNRLDIAPVAGGDDAPVADLRAMLQAAGLGSEGPNDPRQMMWRKLMMNATASVIALVSAGYTSASRTDPDLRDVFIRAFAEMTAIAAAHGYPMETDIDAVIAGLPDHNPSIRQDFIEGRPMEVAEIVAAPVAFARSAGVDAPVLSTLAALAARLARDKGLYAG